MGSLPSLGKGIGLALLVLAAGAGCKHTETGSVEGMMLVAVILDPDVSLLPIRRVEVVMVVPGGLGERFVSLDQTGYRGAQVGVGVDPRDVDGDGKPEAVVSFNGNPFVGSEISFRLKGTVWVPSRIEARAFDGSGSFAEGAASKDTQGRYILFDAATDRIVEVKLRCLKSGGCIVDAGQPSDAASEAGKDAVAGS